MTFADMSPNSTANSYCDIILNVLRQIYNHSKMTKHTISDTPHNNTYKKP